MFQKLYRHLEDIKSGLERDNTNAETTRIGGDVIHQLESLNAKLYALQRQSRLLISGIFLVAAFSCIAFFFSRFDQSRQIDRANSAPASIGIVPTSKETEPAERQVLLRHLAALDSLVVEQARSIQELKELNATSVATFRRIRQHFYRMDVTAARLRPAMSDSLKISQ